LTDESAASDASPRPRQGEPDDDPSTVGISGRAVVIALLLIVVLVVVGVYGLAAWISAGNVGVTVRPQ
jgi:hypothetical protein